MIVVLADQKWIDHCTFDDHVELSSYRTTSLSRDNLELTLCVQILRAVPHVVLFHVRRTVSGGPVLASRDTL